MSSLSVVIPCLNEAATLRTCIHKARKALLLLGLERTEIIVADNGSTDNSLNICREENVRIVTAPVKGYGAALHAGIAASNTQWVLFADADNSYDFGQIPLFVQKLQEGYDLVVGNRFGGQIEKGAMPFLHRYLGTPVISFIGRKSFQVKLTDFNCGMRALSRKAYNALQMQAPGMEYASEMIAKAGLKQLKIAEVPINLYKDGRGRKPHLRTWQDGWKHLRLILLLSPKWLLLFPALFFILIGFTLGTLVGFSYARVFNLVLDIHTLYYASVFFMLGIQLLQFYVLARLYGSNMGLYPARRFSKAVFRWLAFEKALMAGGFIFFAGVGLSAYAVYQWNRVGFGELNPEYIFRIIIPAGFCISLGMQTAMFGFLLYMLRHLKQGGIVGKSES